MDMPHLMPVMPSAPPRLLVVEDEVLVRTVCVRLLKHRQYHVDQVENGLHALERMSEFSYDVVLTDLQMPVLNGLALLRQVKDRYPSTDVILFTANGTIELAKQSLKLGAFDFLTKPLDIDDLERAVRTCLEVRELRRLRTERETLSEMVALLELSRSISTRLDMPSLIHDFIELLHKRFRPNSITLSIMDPHEQKLVLMAHDGVQGGLETGRDMAVSRLNNDDHMLRTHAKLVDHHESSHQNLHILRVHERPVGVLQLTWGANEPALNDQERQLFEVLTSSMAAALENGRLYGRLKDQSLRLVSALAEAIVARDPYTAGHSEQVTKYSVRMGEALGKAELWIERLRYGALLHDVGKIGVPDHILLKPGQLTSDEFEKMKQHPLTGAKIVQAALADVHDIVRHHHERYDGSGYPDGLAGDDIPLESRVIAVADAFDAMTSDRAYRKGMPIDRALSILDDGRNKQWQGDLVEMFTHLIETEGETLLEGKDRPEQDKYGCDGNVSDLLG